MISSYSIKEIFYSPQGEGHRIGTMNVFVRFAGCNLQCTVEKEGFNCDTDFQNGTRMDISEIISVVQDLGGSCRNVIFTGGEPTLQLGAHLVKAFRERNYFLALETNGTRKPPSGLQWISCSPKPGAPPVLKWCDEIRCVIKKGQVPDTQGLSAHHKFVSPACDAPPVEGIPGWKASPSDLNREAIAWAIQWCEKNPDWRISIQTHKILGVR